ncbi:MAG: SDR family oxidoreductase [Actinomycetota bacterium]|nr:SDR family oxidoreductase [Actinomycetota bacterium]
MTDDSTGTGATDVGRANGRIVVVTGGARGIGRAIVDRFAAEGATVVIGDLADPGDLDTELDSAGNREWVPLDVADEGSVLEFAESIRAGHGGVDVLVNNAGIMDARSIAEETVADWDLAMAVNLRGPFLMVKHLLPLMKGRDDPAIVNIGSIEGLGANALHASYAASKAGVHGLTRALAVDLGPQGIRCNAVAPGWIDTDLNRGYVDKHPNRDQALAELASLHPVGRIGDPADVAATVLWLSTPDAGFLTGQVVTVDGGRTTRLSLPASLADD